MFAVGIWCQNDAVSTSVRRHHVSSTLKRRHFTSCAQWVTSYVISVNFRKSDNFCEFLFAIDIEILPKRGLLLKVRIRFLLKKIFSSEFTSNHTPMSPRRPSPSHHHLHLIWDMTKMKIAKWLPLKMYVLRLTIGYCVPILRQTWYQNVLSYRKGHVNKSSDR